MTLAAFLRGTPLETVPLGVPRRLGPLGVLGHLATLILAIVMVAALALIPVALVAAGGALVAQPVVEYWKAIPAELPKIAIAQRNVILDRDGNLIAQTWSENRIEAKNLKAITPLAAQALVATEDKRFYSTKGVDLVGTARSLLKGSGGGSGITQQLIKNLLYFNILTPAHKKGAAVERSVTRKARELKLALEYERTHSKDEILLNYFNTVAFGSPSIYGIETASQYFFGKRASNLTLGEASALVGSAQNASLYNMDDPSRVKSWKARQQDVLGRMVSERYITPAQKRVALREPLKLVKKSTAGSCATSSFPFYCKYTLDYLKNSSRLGSTLEEREAVLSQGGLQIQTHLDVKSTRVLESYMAKNWGFKNRIIAPTAVVDPGTGGVSAFAANRGYGVGSGKTELVLPAQGAATGSAYKLMILAAALNNGYRESDLVIDAPCRLNPGSSYDAPPGGFKNSNGCGKQNGKLNYRQATAYSSNTWFLELERRVGVEKVKDFSRSVGLKAPESITPRSLSYGIGTESNSPIAMAAAFSAFVNGGVYCPPTPVKSLTYSDGREPRYPDSYDPSADACRRVMSPAAASVVLKALRANVSGEVPKAFGLRSAVKGHDTGGKSGTNESFNSAWVHVAATRVLFTDVYDKDNTARGVNNALFKGRSTPMNKNTAQTTGGELMALLLRGTRNVPLNYTSTDTSFEVLRANLESFLTVPSLLGKTPEVAVRELTNMGIMPRVLKMPEDAPTGYPSGVVVKQSIAPGERLARGTEKEVVLTVSR